jgi:hypothetical protein
MLTMGVSPTTFVAQRLNSKIVVDEITVDNVLGAQDAVLTVQDAFTPDASNGVPVPGPIVANRLGINEVQGTCDWWPKDGVKGNLVILGALRIAIATPDAACRITVGYHDE